MRRAFLPGKVAPDRPAKIEKGKQTKAERDQTFEPPARDEDQSDSGHDGRNQQLRRQHNNMANGLKHLRRDTQHEASQTRTHRRTD